MWWLFTSQDNVSLQSLQHILNGVVPTSWQSFMNNKGSAVVGVRMETSIHVSSKNHITFADKQRVLTPGHQGWNDLHSLCRIGMEYYLLNNDDNDNNNDNNNNNDDDDDDDIIHWIMMIIIIIIMIMMMMMMMRRRRRRMTMMIIGTTTIIDIIETMSC